MEATCRLLRGVYAGAGQRWSEKPWEFSSQDNGSRCVPLSIPCVQRESVALHVHCLCCQLSFMSPKGWRCGVHSVSCVASSHPSEPSAMTLIIPPWPGAFVPEKGKKSKNGQSSVCMGFCVHPTVKGRGLQAHVTMLWSSLLLIFPPRKPVVQQSIASPPVPRQA